MSSIDSTLEGSPYPIAYGAGMLKLVQAMHAGAEGLPQYRRWIDEHMGGRILDFRARLMPQIQVFTRLESLDVLDFGCGTGSTAVVLHEAGPDCRISAIDVDEPSLEIARLRFEHHHMSERVDLRSIPPVKQLGDLPFAAESYDFILTNGVLEHVVPFSTRPKVILEMWRLLRPGGMLFISETPNVLWPVDRHTTGLPLVPWLPSGLAARLAVACGRHRSGGDFDAQGRRGMSYWGIVRPLRRAGHHFENLNISRAGNRLLPTGPARGDSAKRRLGNLLVAGLAGRALGALGVPTLALGPFIEYLCLEKS